MGRIRKHKNLSLIEKNYKGLQGEFVCTRFKCLFDLPCISLPIDLHFPYLRSPSTCSKQQNECKILYVDPVFVDAVQSSILHAIVFKLTCTRKTHILSEACALFQIRPSDPSICSSISTIDFTLLRCLLSHCAVKASLQP